MNIFKLDIDVCVWWGYKKNYMRIQAEWKIAVSTTVFLPYFDINKKKSSEAVVHEKFPQQQKRTPTRKIAAWKKNRESENTQFFFICLPLRYKFRIREETGIFPNCWVLFFRCNSFSVPLRHKTIFFRFFHSRYSVRKNILLAVVCFL